MCKQPLGPHYSPRDAYSPTLVSLGSRGIGSRPMTPMTPAFPKPLKLNKHNRYGHCQV